MLRNIRILSFFVVTCLVGCTHQAQLLDPTSNNTVRRAQTLDTPKQIALLLPLKGRHAIAGQAIRAGFLMAYYQASLPKKPTLRIYDTSTNTSVLSVYQTAITEGAEFVIGPLSKQEVGTLAKTKSLPVHVLALNTLPEGITHPGLFQFGLGPEEEAKAVATLAHQQGHHRALVIGVRNAWGHRVTTAFKNSWLAHGHHLESVVWLEQTGDHKKAVQHASLMHNIDMIFLPLPFELARIVRPLLSTDRLNSLPIYSTSHIYEGDYDPVKDRDLESVQFCDMPWMISNDTTTEQAKQEMKMLSPKAMETPRLFAFGMDAFWVSQKLPELLANSNQFIPGMTGQLFLDKRGYIQRQLMWATMIQGVATLQPELSPTSTSP